MFVIWYTLWYMYHMGLFDNVSIPNLWGDYTVEQEELLKQWKAELENEFLDNTAFHDADFLTAFLQNIPKDSWFEYVKNTNSYTLDNNNPKIDKDKVIVTRRAVKTDEPKPERFWTTEYREALLGLRQEIPSGPHRYHSEIMVSTIGNLEKHGLYTSEEIGAESDGEIRIDGKPFTHEKLLFTYKPEREKLDLENYLASGGMSKTEFIQKIKNHFSGNRDTANPEHSA